MYFIGIDIAWKVKKERSAIVVLDENLNFVASAHLTTDKEIVDFVLDYKNYCWLGIDAPLVIPKYLRRMRRTCDLEILKYGISILPVGRALYKKLYGGARGISLTKLFIKKGFVLTDKKPAKKCNAIFEIYPLATWKVLFDYKVPKYKNAPRDVLEKSIKKILHRIVNLKPAVKLPRCIKKFNPEIASVEKIARFTDFLDAFIGAYTLYTFWRYGYKKCTIYGCKKDGFILNFKLCCKVW